MDIALMLSTGKSANDIALALALEMMSAGGTVQDVADALAAIPVTKRNIKVEPMANLLHHAHPMAFLNPEAGGHYGPIIEVRKHPDTPALVRAGIDRLIHHVHAPKSEVIETHDDPQVAGLMEAIVIRLNQMRDDPAITAYGLDVDLFEEDLSELTGGRLFDGFDPAAVQALIDADERQQIVQATRDASEAVLQPVSAKNTAINAWLDALDTTGMTVEQVQSYCDALLASEDGNPA